MRTAALLACSAGVLAAGCGNKTDDPTAPATPAVAPAERAVGVDIASFRFAPETVTVAAGGSVTWTNRDRAPHNAENAMESGPAKFDTGRLDAERQETVKFSRPGVYPYYCIYHRFMEATVTVR